MPNIVDVTFYFANPQQGDDGTPITSLPPESHTLTWQQVIDNAGFSLTTGESLFTELPSSGNYHILRVVNGFYFGTGKSGSLLAIQYRYDDDTDGWISTVQYQAASAEHTDTMAGNWIKGLTYEQILAHENWKGKPYIGYENDYIEVLMERILPPMSLTLDPMTKSIMEGDDVTFTYSVTDYVEGDPTLTWSFDTALITPIEEAAGSKTLSFNQEGTYQVRLTAANSINQSVTKTATITVQDVPLEESQISLTPSTITVYLGRAATFDALHPYSEEGSWIIDRTKLGTILTDPKKLVVVAHEAGSYSIVYRVHGFEARAILYVIEPNVNEPEPEEPVDPVEPVPPSLPNTPPDAGDSQSLIFDLMDASRPIPSLYKYPNIMKRNARYRGHRESEKVLNDHQEQIYDIRQLHKGISSLENMKEQTIRSWFHGVESASISMILKEYAMNLAKASANSPQSHEEPVRVLENDMVQLSGTSFEEQIVGVYGIKQRMQELDERIAEAERRYREYENAYE